jgi:hypothetical protein
VQQSRNTATHPNKRFIGISPEKNIFSLGTSQSAALIQIKASSYVKPIPPARRSDKTRGNPIRETISSDKAS